MSAGQFNQIDPNKSSAQDIIDYAFQPFNFDVIDGLKYEIDITQPAKYDLNGGCSEPECKPYCKFDNG